MDVIVVDTSVALRWVLPDETEVVSQTLLSRWVAQEVLLFAPPVFLAEATSGLRQAYAARRISEQELVSGVQTIRDVQPHILAPSGLYEQALQASLRYGSRSVYDFLFFALAERLGAELWTGDARFVRAIQPSVPWVKLL